MPRRRLARRARARPTSTGARRGSRGTGGAPARAGAPGIARGEHAARRRHEELAAAEQEPERGRPSAPLRRREARDEALLRSVHGGQRSRRLAAPPWRGVADDRGRYGVRQLRRRASRGVRDVFAASLRERARRSAPRVAVVARRRARVSLLGGPRRPGAHAAVDGRHARERLLDDEGHDRALRAPARRGRASSTSTRRSRATGPSSPRPGRARSRCAGCSRTARASRRCGSSCPREALYDWDAMAAALAAETPWWTPGERHGYHALTFGWLVGEVVRRVTGKSVGTLLPRRDRRPARRRLPHRPRRARARPRRASSSAMATQPAPDDRRRSA